MFLNGAVYVETNCSQWGHALHVERLLQVLFQPIPNIVQHSMFIDKIKSLGSQLIDLIFEAQ
jgi:hypothetical protein